jgi:TolB-like protein/DNA-binding winged helix-turn-helix (wHTH) protein
MLEVPSHESQRAGTSMAGPVYQFADFRLDCGSFELLRKNRAVRMERKPMELLILLVSRQGQLVSRAEIVQRLWSSEVFVDTEHGINTAIRKIRYVLGDDPDNPRFVQTLPSRGYRFICPVLSGEGQPGEAESPVAAATPVVETGALDRRLTARPRFLITILVSCLVVALSVIVYLGRWRMRAGQIPGSGHVILAVLPFQNLSGDPGQEYFSDGLTEEVIAQLGALNPDQLGVIARTTSMAYKHTSKSVEQIGSELGAGYVLESSVRRDGNQVRITVQLIRVHDQVHVWARSYDRQISHSIELQEEVATAVAEQIGVKLSPSYKDRAIPHHLDAEANEDYLRGRYFWNQFTPEGYRKAISYFQQAIERDANFAEAYSGLADSYNFLVVMDSIPASEGEPKALEAARRAVSLGDNLAEAHASLAAVLGVSEWNWSGSEDEYKRAIALNPSYAMARRLYAALFSNTQRHREALEQINEAMRLDPLSLPNNAEVVRTLYYARNYDQAIEKGQKAMQLDPNYVRTHFWLGRVYSQKAMHREAIAASEKILEAMPDSTLGLTEMAYSLAVAGRGDEARQILRRLEERSTSAFVPAYDFAVIHLALDEEEIAMRYMQQAYENRDWALLVLAVEPRLDPLRRDPRFQVILAKLRFP